MSGVQVTEQTVKELCDVAQLAHGRLGDLKSVAHTCVPPTVIDAMRTVGVPTLTGTD